MRLLTASQKYLHASHRAGDFGIEAPKSFEGWADFFPRYTVLPWLNGRKHRRLQIMRDYLRVAFHRVPIAEDRRRPITRAVHELISFPARWRLEHDVYTCPFEIWLKNLVNRTFESPKPKVDAQQLSTDPVTC